LNTTLAAASQKFSLDLAAGAPLLAQSLGVRIAQADIFGLYQSILANPAGFGYTNVTTPAQGLAVNPDQYLFWDFASHPTTTGGHLIALTAQSAITSTFVPEPATWTVAVGGFFLLLSGKARVD
jgi:phospholipase/lecithinase/hemolysin